MRYIEFSDGTIALSTGAATSHRDLLRFIRRSPDDAVSAGFMAARYEPTQHWDAWGSSVGLKLAANKALNVPSELFVGKHRGGLVYANRAEVLASLEDVQQAVWGLTEESPWGDVCPVYAPLHPQHKLRSDEATCH